MELRHLKSGTDVRGIGGFQPMLVIALGEFGFVMGAAGLVTI